MQQFTRTDNTGRDRIYVFKPCHRSHASLTYDHAVEVCPDCRKASFVATMRARGITVKPPTYKGPWFHLPSPERLALWESAAAAWG